MKIYLLKWRTLAPNLMRAGRRILAAAETTAASLSGFAALLTRIGAGH
ncbi:MAG: hypothetical protein AAFW82_05625 [Pseudomonadota bacterium]